MVRHQFYDSSFITQTLVGVACVSTESDCSLCQHKPPTQQQREVINHY